MVLLKMALVLGPARHALGGGDMDGNFTKKINSSLEIISLMKDCGMLNPFTMKLIMSAHLGRNSSREIMALQNAAFVAKMYSSPFKKPDSSVTGQINFAFSENRIPIGMNPSECHVLIAGQTGSGKSTLLRLAFSQALAMGMKVWLFVKSKEMRSLLDVDRDILVVNFDGQIKINPLEPCGMDAGDFCNVFSDIFIQSQRLYDGTKNYLMEILNFLYRRHSEDGIHPSMHDLYYYVRAMKHKPMSRTAHYQESALNRLGGMISGNLGRVFDCSTGHEKSLVERSCIFEIDRLTAEQQVFIVNLLLTKLFYHRLSRSRDNWIFAGIDDANLVFDASFEKRPDFGLPIIHHLLSTSRKAGINVFCCTQAPHKLGSSIHSNSAIKIMAGFSDGVDAEFMQRSMGSFSDEQKDFFSKLTRGQIIIKNSLRFPEPLFGIIPVIPEPRVIAEQDVITNNERQIAEMPAIVPRYAPKKPESDSKGTNSDEKDWLMAVNLNQYRKTLTEMHGIAGFSMCKGTRIAKKLEDSGMIKIVGIVKGKGVSKYPILLEPAYVLLGIEEKKFYGKGAGHGHVIWQHLIAEHFKEHKPEIELNKNGKFIDVAVHHEDKLIAVEVAMTSVNEKANIERDINLARADFVIVACRDKKVLQEAEAIISDLDGEFETRAKALLLSKILSMNLSDLIKTDE